MVGAPGCTAAAHRRRRTDQEQRDRLAEHPRGVRERGAELSRRGRIAADPGTPARSESRRMAARARRTDLAGRRPAVPPSGQAQILPVDAAENRHGWSLYRRPGGPARCDGRYSAAASRSPLPGDNHRRAPDRAVSDWLVVYERLLEASRRQPDWRCASASRRGTPPWQSASPTTAVPFIRSSVSWTSWASASAIRT